MLNVKNIFIRLQERVKLSHAGNLTTVNWYFYLPIIVSSFLVLSMFYIITNTLLFFIDTTDTNQSISYASVSKPSANTVSNIPQWHLFGISAEPNATALTSLPLKLLGVLVQTPAKFSEAIINVNSEKEKIYRVGDTLPGGAILYAVHADDVTIQYRGRFEKLLLNKINQTPSNDTQLPSSPTVNNQYPNNLASSPVLNDFIRNKMKELSNGS